MMDTTMIGFTQQTVRRHHIQCEAETGILPGGVVKNVSAAGMGGRIPREAAAGE